MTRANNLSCYMHLCLVLAIFCIAERASANDVQTTTSFDVRDSLQKTLDVFSPDIVVVPQREETFSSSSSSSSSTSIAGYSIELHTRLSVEGKPDVEDYTTLTLARLDRDSARVSSLLLTRAAAVVDGKNITSAVLAYGRGEYLAQVGFGTPASGFYLIADTGSDLTWLQCDPCNPCIPQIGLPNNFDPDLSSTYMSRGISYEQEYGDGSYTVGDLAMESITFGGGSAAASRWRRMKIGCGHENEGLFAGAAGILGLGRGPDSFPSQLNVDSFSYCLVDKDSRKPSTLEFNSSTHTPSPPDAVVVASLIRKVGPRASTFYYVDLIGINIGGSKEMIPIDGANTTTGGDEGGVILDSGTTLTYLKPSIYIPFRQDFINAARNLTPVFPPADLPFDTCFDLSNKRSVDVPTVSFHFATSKKPLVLPAENYLIPVGVNGTHCLAFLPVLNSLLSIIGNVQQQGMRVTYDLLNSKVRGGLGPVQGVQLHKAQKK